MENINNENIKTTPGRAENKKIWVILGAIALLLVAIAVGASRYSGKNAAEEGLDQCGPGDVFNQATGEPCFPPCEAPGDLFNRDTGEACPPDPAPEALTSPDAAAPAPAPGPIVQ